MSQTPRQQEPQSAPLDDADSAALAEGVIDLDEARPAVEEPTGDEPPGLDSERPVLLEDRRDNGDDGLDVEEPMDPRDA